jgi:hypothetical protein
VAEVLFQGDRQFYFLAQPVSGTLGQGQGEEMLGRAAPEAGTYQALWLPLTHLLTEPVYPRDLCRLILAAAPIGLWPATPASLRDPG